MFVKIIKRQNAHVQKEILYECGRVTIDNKEEEITIEMEGCPVSMGKETISVALQKQDTSIYFMNGYGKTIDSIHFGDWKKEGKDARSDCS